MNIFYLHKDYGVAARSMTNRHVVKMILESAQMLCTAHRVLDGMPAELIKNGRRRLEFIHPTLNNELYLTAHINHPSSIWIREDVSQYMWLYNHMMELGYEYTRRYNREHDTITRLGKILSVPPRNIEHDKFVDPPCCMPDQYKTGDSISSYHNYYRAEKLKYDFDIERFNKFYSVI